jgi:hypothetical protein
MQEDFLQNLGDIEVSVVAQVQIEIARGSVEVHVAVLELNEGGAVPVVGKSEDDFLVGDGLNQGFLDHVISALLLEPKKIIA